MHKEKNMGFYEQISKYYDCIFPVGQAQLEFIKQAAGSPPAKVLDVACGSGGYAAELSKAGYTVAAVDIDEKMVEKAKEKVQSENLSADILRCDMKELEKKLSPGFNCIFCIGNSIVHLDSQDEILEALRQMHALMEKGGTLILQIINYDRIIKYKIDELPPIIIEDVNLEFIRKYELSEDGRHIDFNTTLAVDENGEKMEFKNSVKLLPLESRTMHELLEKAGFGNIEFFGDFKQSTYDENSFMLVVRAVRIN